jgi:peptidoglycan-N-acetylglucosamine deacetylase
VDMPLPANTNIKWRDERRAQKKAVMETSDHQPQVHPLIKTRKRLRGVKTAVHGQRKCSRIRIAAVMLTCLLLGLAAQAKGTMRNEMPAALAYQSKTQLVRLAGGATEKRAYPQTIQPAVDSELRRLIDAMAETMTAALPDKCSLVNNALSDTGAYMSRSGDSWMSFLLVGRAAYNREQIAVAMDTRCYDMASGKQLTLNDLFDANSEGFDILARAARTQLSRYFTQDTAIPGALDSLCTRDALLKARFTVEAGRLGLHYRADTLFPGRNTLMHVYVYYSKLHPYMTKNARKQTDNSIYRLAALTFDDGPGRGSSNMLMDTLRGNGAGASFFLIGKSIGKNLDIVSREQDAGFTVGYHSYTHTVHDMRNGQIAEELALYTDSIYGATGLAPTIMRPPGGHYLPYINAIIPFPIINWSCNYNCVPGDGDVMLTHDVSFDQTKYIENIVRYQPMKGFLFVTIEELFDIRGFTFQPNTVYRSLVREDLASLPAMRENSVR